MQCIEAQFEEILVTKTKSTGEQSADFPIDALHLSTAQAGFVEAQDSAGMAFEGFGHCGELTDCAGVGFGAPFSQQCPRFAAVGLLPELSEFLLQQIRTLQGLVDFQAALQAAGGVLFQILFAV